MAIFSTPEVRERYQRIARHYDRSILLLRLCGFRERHYRRAAVAALALRPGDRVVEVGCGTGRNLGLLREAVGTQGEVIGVDLSGAMLAEARRKTRAAGWDNVTLIEADAAEYDFPEETTAILSTFAITLASDYDTILKRAAEALSPAGHLVVMDLKLPPRWPGWLVRAVALANRPYGVTLGLADRHPWESVRRYTDECLFKDYYSGALFLSAGIARC